MKRAILYARVSGDDRGKDGRNLAGQLEMCREYAQGHGYQIVDELAEDDRGASGARIDLPGLTKARDLAQAGEYDTLVVREIDRLSRNLAKQLIVEEELKRAGVGIEYVLGEYPDTPEGNLQKHVKAAVAEYEREKISERMTRGRRNTVKGGNILVHGRPPYGYRKAEVEAHKLVVYQLDGTIEERERTPGDGLEIGKRILIAHEPEARIVRLIFQWYTVGDNDKPPLSIYGIAQRLTKMGIPTPADRDKRIAKQRGVGEWNRATIRKILKRETYTGIWHYGKVKNSGTKNVHNARDTWLKVNVPAIIPRETWETAQAQMKENKSNSPRNAKHDYLLRRRLKCGKCGAKMAGVTNSERKGGYSYYYCPVHLHPEYAKECTQTTNFRVDYVDATVWVWVCGIFSDPELFFQALQREQERREQASKPLYDRLAVIDDLLADNRAQLKRALDLYLEGGDLRDLLEESKERLQTTIDDLKREREQLTARLEAATLTDGQIESLAEAMREVGEGLDLANADFEKQRWIIERLSLTATLEMVNGEQFVHVECVGGSKSLRVMTTTIGRYFLKA